MKILPSLTTILPWMLALAPLGAMAAPCLPTPELIALDTQYEDATRRGDAAFLDQLLAEDFVWVHTLASAIEDKSVILARARKPAGEPPKSRTTSGVRAHILGDTVVLRGLSTVEQWNADGKTWRSNRYQFMRTYVNDNGRCKLLALQTMKVWSSDKQLPSYLTGKWSTAESLFAGTDKQSEVQLRADGYGLMAGSSAAPHRIDGKDDGKPLPRAIIGFPTRAALDGDGLVLTPFMPGAPAQQRDLKFHCRYDPSGPALVCIGPDKVVLTMKRRSDTVEAEAVRMLDAIVAKENASQP
ncbi:nuclear transport factor 2 family protein [Oxalobacteraceae bacterium A2-2]